MMLPPTPLFFISENRLFGTSLRKPKNLPSFIIRIFPYDKGRSFAVSCFANSALRKSRAAWTVSLMTPQHCREFRRFSVSGGSFFRWKIRRPLPDVRLSVDNRL